MAAVAGRCATAAARARLPARRNMIELRFEACCLLSWLPAAWLDRGSRPLHYAPAWMGGGVEEGHQSGAKRLVDRGPAGIVGGIGARGGNCMGRYDEAGVALAHSSPDSVFFGVGGSLGLARARFNPPPPRTAVLLGRCWSSDPSRTDHKWPCLHAHPSIKQTGRSKEGLGIVGYLLLGYAHRGSTHHHPNLDRSIACVLRHDGAAASDTRSRSSVPAGARAGRAVAGGEPAAAAGIGLCAGRPASPESSSIKG